MNTLNKTITSQFFNDPTEGRTLLKASWKEHYEMAKKGEYTLTASQHLIYLVLLGKDWRKAFIKASNANKIANGYTDSHVAIGRVITYGYYFDNIMNSSVFKDLVSVRGRTLIKLLLRNMTSNKDLTLDAYITQEEMAKYLELSNV